VNPIAWEVLEYAEEYRLERMSVPGGWLYRSVVLNRNGWILNASIAFVPDAGGGT